MLKMLEKPFAITKEKLLKAAEMSKMLRVFWTIGPLTHPLRLTNLTFIWRKDAQTAEMLEVLKTIFHV